MIPLLGSLRREVQDQFLQAAPPEYMPFLRRAEDESFLLCSDAPRRLPDHQKTAGMILDSGLILLEKDDLWFFDAPVPRYEALAASLSIQTAAKPEDEASLSVWALMNMLRLHPCPVCSQPLWAVRSVLKAMEEGGQAVQTLALKLAPRMAILLRKKEPLPSLAGDLLNAWLWGTIQREVF